MVVMPPGEVPGTLEVASLVQQADRQLDQNCLRPIRGGARPATSPDARQERIRDLLHQQARRDEFGIAGSEPVQEEDRR